MKNIIIGLAVIAGLLIVLTTNPGITGASVLVGGEWEEGYKNIYRCANERTLERQYLYKDGSARYDKIQCRANEVCKSTSSIAAKCVEQWPEPEFLEGSFEYGTHASKSIDFKWGYKKGIGFKEGIFTHPASNPRVDVAMTRRSGDELYVKPRVGHSVRLFRFIDDVTYNDCITDPKQGRGRNQPIATGESMCFETQDGDVAIVSGNWKERRLTSSDLIYWRLYLVG